jgi:hypothetical protein
MSRKLDNKPPLVVPNKPFMVALGTSHTFGCCDDYEDGVISGKTAHEQVAQQLGLECIKIGLPGCNNSELLQATNELVTRGVLKDPNCKLMVLEARLLNGQSAVPYNSVANRPYVFTDPKTGSNNQFGRASLESYLQLNERWGRGLVDHWGDNDICNALYQSASMQDWRRGVTKKFWQPLEHPLTPSEIAYAKKILDTYKQVHILDGMGPAACLDDLIKIEAIKNIAVSSGVEFLWESLDARSIWYKIGKMMLGDTSTLFDHLINFDQSIRERLNCLDGTSDEGGWLQVDGPISMSHQCKCNHLNEKGHVLWAKQLKKRIKPLIENI